MREHFVSEALKPVTATCDTSRMAAGEPGLPLEFSWHDETIRISRVLRTWRETGKCRHGSGENYVRKHWFEVCTDSEKTLRIYFERQSRGGPKGVRWWLFSILEPDEAAVAD